MPELCRFFNIIITMFFSDKHHKPHFHATYNEYEASIGIDGELLAGKFPPKQLKLVNYTKLGIMLSENCRSEKLNL